VEIEILNIQKKIKVNKKNIKNTASAFLKYLKQRKDCILNIVFVSPARIKHINKNCFNKKSITDVIAIEPGKFCGDIYDNYLGDIIICPQKAKENSIKFKTSLEKETILYLAHGILHLLGYDDLRKKDSLKMEMKQQELMQYYEKI